MIHTVPRGTMARPLVPPHMLEAKGARQLKPSKLPQRVIDADATTRACWILEQTMLRRATAMRRVR